MPIEISAESRKKIDESIQRFVLEEFNEEIGVLRTQRLFEFVVRLIGATIYNQAINDAQAWLQGKLLDLEGDLHEVVELAPRE